MFLWADLRSLLGTDPPTDPPSWEAERALWEQLFRTPGCGLLLTPGADCGAAEPGWFRLCFAAVEAEALPSIGPRLQALRRARGLAGRVDGAAAGVGAAGAAAAGDKQLV